MKIGRRLYVTTGKEWRSWLRRNHKKAKEIWLIYYKKNSGKPRIPYNDAVEEALCFGWIDSIVKAIDEKKFAQRFSPRKGNSRLSRLNEERIRRLIKRKRMDSAGLAAVRHVFNLADDGKFSIPDDIVRALKKDKTTWEHFQAFPASYKKIRVGWIDGARKRPEIFQQRLEYFVKMTTRNKKFGMVQ